MSDVAAIEIVALIFAGLHFFTLANCHLYMDALHKPAIYLQFTALV